MKNSIIALLLVHILNMYDGWAVQGLARLLVSLALMALISIILNELEKILRFARKEVIDITDRA